MHKPFLKRMPELPFEQAHGGAGKRQLLLTEADHISPNLEAMAHTFLETGHSFDWHDHPGVDEFFVALAGEGKVTFANKDELAYQKGDLVYMPADMAHRIDALGPVASEFYFVRVKA